MCCTPQESGLEEVKGGKGVPTTRRCGYAPDRVRVVAISEEVRKEVREMGEEGEEGMMPEMMM